MEDKIFDHIIKGKLEQMQAPPMPSDAWQQFAAKLDAREFNPEKNTEIDGLAQRHLANKEMPMHAPAWEQMAARLDRTSTLLYRLRTAKVAEAAILVLTFLNLDAFQVEPARWQTPTKPQTTQPMAAVTEPIPAATSTITTSEAAALTTTTSTIAQVDAPVSAAQQSNAAKTPNAGTRTGANLATFAKASATRSNDVAEKAAFAADQVSEQKIMTTLAATNMVNGQHQITDALAGATQNATTDLGASGQLRPITDTPDAVNTEAVATISTLAAQALAIRNEPKLTLQLPVFAVSNRTSIALLAHAGPDFLRLDGVDAKVRGYSAGLAVARRSGKWGVETGFDYAHFNYATKPTKEILGGNPQVGFVGRSLRSIDFDFVNVPLRLTRSLFKKRGTEVIAGAGAQLMAAVQVAPDYNAYYAPGSLPPDPFQPYQIQRTIIPSTAQGIFEGGAFADNVQLSGTVNIRVEQYLGASNKKLFIEVNGQMPLTKSKIGPADDHFSGIGLRTGLVTML
jgi:hypothetical protein